MLLARLFCLFVCLWFLSTRLRRSLQATAEVSTDVAPLRDAVDSAERQHAHSEQEKPSRPGGGAGGGRAGTEPAGHVLSTPKRDTWRDAGVEQASQSPQANGLVQSMLSQETLFTPLRQRESYYTKFLAERGENLPEDELNRYRRQFGLVRKICEVLEKEPFDVNKLLYLMQLLQDSGDPPPDVNSLTAAH